MITVSIATKILHNHRFMGADIGNRVGENIGAFLLKQRRRLTAVRDARHQPVVGGDRHRQSGAARTDGKAAHGIGKMLCRDADTASTASGADQVPHVGMLA